MGKTTRFFKSLFGWSFFKTHGDKHAMVQPRHTPRHHRSSGQTTDGSSSSNHAIAVAAATTAADDAVAAAHAAAEVVRMTNRTAVVGFGYGVAGEWAAVKIQSYYRGYLARKALRALKSLVKLQALVRGHIVRKQDADDYRRLQALVRVRVQTRARACQVQITESPHSTTKGPPTPEKFEHVHRSRMIKHNQPSMLKNNCSRLYDDRTEKILEMDTTKSHTRRRSLFQPDQISYSHSQSLTTSRGSTFHPMGPSPSGSCEVSSLTGPLKWFPRDFEEQVSLSTVQNSPPFYAYTSKNGSMRVSPFTQAKSDSSRSCLSGYSDQPNYMAYTESSRAKVRSVSAPRQRPHLEFLSTTKRYSVYGYGSVAHRGSNLRDSFVSKAYPGSGRLDRLGMPIGGIGFRESEFSGGYWN